MTFLVSYHQLTALLVLGGRSKHLASNHRTVTNLLLRINYCINKIALDLLVPLLT